jgi:hypothetical protein
MSLGTILLIIIVIILLGGFSGFDWMSSFGGRPWRPESGGAGQDVRSRTGWVSNGILTCGNCHSPKGPVICGLAIERLDRLLSALIPTGDKTERCWFVR